MPSRRHDERPKERASDGAKGGERAGERIAKLLARAGIASRREIERMIADGRVALDGTPIDTPATLLSSLAGITVDGNPVAAPAPARLFLYHKPPGLLVTERDPRGRPTIYDRLPADLPRVVPVGRLDLATEGLLLLTTDGGFKRQLELPATGVERSYRARAYGIVSQAQLEDLMDGIEIEGIRYGSIDANIERRTGANVWIELTLAEGKNREVRRVLEHLGLQVSRLIRTRYGPFVLGDLPAGDVGEVRSHDLVAFRRTLKGGSPDEPIGLPAAEAPRPGFRTAPTSDRAARSRRQTASQVPPATRPRGNDRPARPAAVRGTGAAHPAGEATARPPRIDRPAKTPRPARPSAAPRSDRPAEPRRAAEPVRPGFRTAATTDRAQRTRRPHPSAPDGAPSLSHREREGARSAQPSGKGEGDGAPNRSRSTTTGRLGAKLPRSTKPPRSAAPALPGTKPPRPTRPAPSRGPRGPKR